MSLPLLGAGLAVDVLPFTPASISGLQLWLDASDASTLFQNSDGTTAATADGDPVGYWGDKSGNGRHATQSDGTKKPALKLALENGRNVIQFDSSNDTVSGTSGTNYPRHYFVVLRFPMPQADVRIMQYKYFSIGLSSASSYNLNIVRDGVAWNTITLIPAIPYSNTGKYILELAKSSQTNDELIVNNTSYSTYSNSTVVANSTYSLLICGKVCEYIVYDQSLSTDAKNNVRSYLNTKWGVY